MSIPLRKIYRSVKRKENRKKRQRRPDCYYYFQNYFHIITVMLISQGGLGFRKMLLRFYLHFSIPDLICGIAAFIGSKLLINYEDPLPRGSVHHFTCTYHPKLAQYTDTPKLLQLSWYLQLSDS